MTFKRVEQNASAINYFFYLETLIFHSFMGTFTSMAIHNLGKETTLSLILFLKYVTITTQYYVRLKLKISTKNCLIECRRGLSHSSIRLLSYITIIILIRTHKNIGRVTFTRISIFSLQYTRRAARARATHSFCNISNNAQVAQ